MKRLSILLFSLVVAGVVSARTQYVYRFQNPSLGDNERLDNLLSLMTLDEKVEALSTNLGVPRLGIRDTGHSEGLHGMALGGPGNWGGRHVVNGNVVADEYPTTIFPQAYGLGATWDTDLIRRVADAEATEVRYYTQNPNYQKGGLVMRAPNADLARDPRWGRTEESYGEDPYLTSRMAVGFIKGLQGDSPRYWKTASLMKHFLANSNEDGRDSTSSNFGDNLFYGYYANPFLAGINEGGAQAFMASYNSWNGTPMSVNPILNEVRRDYNMNGIICTDGGALNLLIKAHKAYPTFAEGAAAVVKAGIGQFLDTYKPYVYEALRKGLLTEADIDKAIRGNFYVALRLGLLDGDQTRLPYAAIGTTDTVAPWTRPEVKQLARLATDESIVLLKNSDRLLPLDMNKVKSIAVIGPLANEVLQDWYSGTPAYAVTILQGIKDAVGDGVKVTYEPSDAEGKAYEAASKAGVAIVCVGNHPYGTDARWLYSPVPSDGREAVDRKALSLEQEDLARVVYKANPNTVMVLVSNFPFAINWSEANLPAILQVTHCSQEQGNGVADVLFGKYNPAGRTTQTWVKSIADLPPMMDYDITHGRTYMYSRTEPLYPFGYGLSYTTFEYSDFAVKDFTVNSGKLSAKVSVKVMNTGNRDGDEVVQLYISTPEGDGSRPIKQLVGFKRVRVAQGKVADVELDVANVNLFNWRDAAGNVPGNVSLTVGSSSDDIKATRLFEMNKAK